jgi:hypothetical protein
MYIPAYTIKDLETFSPLGEWVLVADNDHTAILARFYNANWAVYDTALVCDSDAETLEAA